MEEILQMWNNLGAGRIYIIIVLGFFVLSLFFSRLSKNNINARANFWLQSNPEASKIYLDPKSDIIRTNNLVVESVDGLYERISFMEGNNLGLYLNPGVHKLEVRFETTRPGILHKRVTDIYGPVSLEVDIEARKIYTLCFDTKEKDFLIKEKI